MYSSRLLTLCFEIVLKSVKVCTTGMSSRTLYAQHPVSLRIFPSLPGSRLRFLSRCKFSTICEHTFKPCVRNCSREREGLYNGNAQQNSLCAASCVTKDIPVSPRFSPTFFYPDANSVQYVSTPLNPVFEIVQGSVKVCTTGMSSRTLYAQHPVSLRIFPPLPGSRLRFLSPGKFSTLQCTVFDALQPKLMRSQ